ncbi:uncharacterized protein PITG_03810 [Phytophthora infestans T30-4]|uniref:Uncharacterized protein n=1 Tax=Phytophthora infestans (strain T30-4) TaxID=403677 RepID=D0MYK5_PHYIT|nr:uncharacterized protein PITG_03810 [Phytophthora infestans T30-4]EEY66253.1 conserved hypothetical protein [Phytophthora infestans T30-4]|eukprot:XP_002906852.1 conserved hypothetical protein [Phytophthora infestans T30-4]
MQTPGGSIAPRADVDNRTLREKSGFWKDVQAAFVQRGVDPSVVKPHSSKKLFDMSKEVIRLYFSAEERFTASGKNENDFANFVNKNGAVFYLPKWLNRLQEVRELLLLERQKWIETLRSVEL